MKRPQWIDTWSEWLNRDNRASWIIFALFALLTFAKTLLFNHYAFHHHMVPDVMNSPVGFFGTLLPKLSMAVLLASFTFLMKDKRWMILLSFIIDTWCVANLIYMRNNYILLDAEAFNSSSNLHGYSASILIYIEWGIDLLFYLLTCLMSLIFVFTNRSPRSWQWALATMMAGVLLHFAGDTLNGAYPHNTIRRDGREQVYGTDFSTTVGRTSVLESPIYIISDYAQMVKNQLPEHPLTERDRDLVAPLASGNPELQVDEPLIIILLESLENWVCREDVMPNLWRLTQSDHVLYADHVHTQIVGAPSADGQMIVNTGLLPIDAGATCLHYSHNEFPAIMKVVSGHTVCLLPHDPSVWNQTEMSPAFGYDTTIVFSDIDTLLFARLNQLVDAGEKHIQCITQSTHAPFVNQKYSSLETPNDMPWVMSSYIRGFNALDDGLGLFIRKLETDERLRNYTVVITGDHRILHKEKREQMMRYSREHGLDYNAADDCLPLIIRSPHIKGNIHVTDEAYQMDIYPTVLSLLQATDYDWKGFGVNLCDSTARHNRPLNPRQAAVLSDRMIRNDYFRVYTRWGDE
ncbi:MAG: sulfatase-like hydrolase/transferase [Paludibacteraceae bacterium]|nr:sulfatase-like hydrolase/transferase [Paludibacteraceae bacterium]